MKPTPPPRPLVGYIRVSTDEQVKSGLSLESQEAKVRGMAAAKGVELLDVISDAGESAKSLARPGMQRIMTMARNKEISGVVIAKLDRLTRSVRDLSEIVDLFNRRDVALISVGETLDTGTAVGRMMLNVIVVISQWEREAISERTSAALQQKRVRGESTGNPPYGWRVEDGKLVVAADERLILNFVKFRRTQHSLDSIAVELNNLGHKTRCGSRWRKQYVAAILKGVAA